MSDLPPELRALGTIEEQYWRPIEAITSLESLLTDDSFFADPGGHVALYSDHGVVHVRDVAERAADMAVRLQGSLLAPRSPERVGFVSGVARLLAYLHDVGMTPVNRWGRPVHAQYAAQVPYTEEFRPILDELWRHGALGLRDRIEQIVAAAGDTAGPPLLVLQEVLATTVAHSKSTVPAAVLDDPVRFRDAVRRAVLTPLSELAAPAGHRATDDAASPAAVDRYVELGRDPQHDSFRWLVDREEPVLTFATDVVDAIRVLRAADALRQRGTTLRTSSGFEICADLATGHGVFALRTADRRVLVLMVDPNPYSGAEANVDLADLDEAGSLRISFHRERFADPGCVERITRETAALVADIEADVLGSFDSSAGTSVARTVTLVRRAPDSPLVAAVAALAGTLPRLAGRVLVVDEPPITLAREPIDWATAGHPFEPTPQRVDAVLGELARRGMNVAAIDRGMAFADVRTVRLRRGDDVVFPHTEATAVLVPTGPGLEVVATGGYGHRIVPPWVPVGVTGVVRGGERNAHVRAAADVEVLVIPADRYLREWFRPYRPAELREAARGWIRDSDW